MATLWFSVSSLILLFTVIELLFEAHSTTYWGDIEILKELKNGLDPNSVSPGKCLNSWDFAVDPCDNLFGEKFTCGFRCDVVVSHTSRVTELALDQEGYVGSLASTTWNLPYLHTLDLSGNFFAGSIPDSLSNLTRLQRLSLSGNSLSDPVSASIGSLYSLEEVYLDHNSISSQRSKEFKKARRQQTQRRVSRSGPTQFSPVLRRQRQCHLRRTPDVMTGQSSQTVKQRDILGFGFLSTRATRWWFRFVVSAKSISCPRFNLQRVAGGPSGKHI